MHDSAALSLIPASCGGASYAPRHTAIKALWLMRSQGLHCWSLCGSGSVSNAAAVVVVKSTQRRPMAMISRSSDLLLLCTALAHNAHAFIPPVTHIDHCLTSRIPPSHGSPAVVAAKGGRCSRVWFRPPGDVPVVESLDKHANWSIAEAEPLPDKNEFRMPWLAPVAPPRRGWVEKTIVADAAHNGTEGDVEAVRELEEIERIEVGMGMGEKAPVVFVSRLGSVGVNQTAGNVSWLRRVGEDDLKLPEPQHRVFTYRQAGWPSRLSCAFWRRVNLWPFGRKIPLNTVVTATIKGDDLSLVSDDISPSLSRIFQEPPVGWIEPLSPFIKAAHDPRVKAMILRIGQLTCGYGKIQELRRHMEYFKSSGKRLVAYMDTGTEKEYLAALGADDVYMSPGGSLRLQGFVSSANFVRGVFDKVGLEPTVVRIGEYKGAGDTIARTNSTEAFREVQWTLVNQTADYWVQQVAADTNKTADEITSLWSDPVSDPPRLAHRKLITAALYYDQVKELVCDQYRVRKFPWSLKERPAKTMGMKPFLRALGRKQRVLPALPGLKGPRIAVINAAGDIGPTGAITAPELTELLEQAQRDGSIKAVVLRIDSPGGDALTSELIWRRILKLRSVKPVVASMVDVAASGGYFLAMGCNAIVAEETTLTGSIGVVAVLFKLRQLFDKIGLNEESVAIGKYAKFFLPSHQLSDDERALFERDVQESYQDFVKKAAWCRNWTWEEADNVAQGRVWKGSDALRLGLVDEHGGVWRAIEIAKRLAKIPDKRSVAVARVKTLKRFFGARKDEDEDASLVAPSSALYGMGGVSSGRPMAVADDIIGDYMRAIGASTPGVKPWAQGVGLGLLGSLALQEEYGPMVEKVLQGGADAVLRQLINLP